jgi:topoisomerase-4 subunit A
LIDTQGNWGNIYTGDSAAAARYIEARLLLLRWKWFLILKQRNGQNLMTEEIMSRLISRKFPLLLAQGVEGIGVGLSTKFFRIILMN